MTVLLVVQIILVVCMVAVILLQKSSSDGFTGASGGGGLMSGRATGNMMTRITAILATLFIINSLVLAYLSSHTQEKESVIGDSDAALVPAIPVEGGSQGGVAIPDVLPVELPEGGSPAKNAPAKAVPAEKIPEVPVEE